MSLHCVISHLLLNVCDSIIKQRYRYSAKLCKYSFHQLTELTLITVRALVLTEHVEVLAPAFFLLRYIISHLPAVKTRQTL